MPSTSLDAVILHTWASSQESVICTFTLQLFNYEIIQTDTMWNKPKPSLLSHSENGPKNISFVETWFPFFHKLTALR